MSHARRTLGTLRCWFASHDLEIGTEIVRGIDEAIRIYDKLLIILSESSVQSHWVAFEVSTALHREVEEGRAMLFPIRLDAAVLHTPGGWAAQLRTRHIGDFRGRKTTTATRRRSPGCSGISRRRTRPGSRVQSRRSPIT